MNSLRWLYAIPLRLRSLIRRRQMEADLDEELRDHIERKTEEGVANGLTIEEARRIALVELGGIEQRKEDCRDARGVRWLEEFLQDVRYGFRLLRKNPGFSAIVVLALALGLGANTALFSLCNSVLLRALPVRDPERLIVLSVANERSDSIQSFSYPMYRELRDRNTVFSGMLAQAGAEMNATFAGESEKAKGKLVSGNYFETLGVQPWLGRLFTQADDRTPGAHPVTVLSYQYWQRRFGGDPAVVGRKLILNNHPMTIVGVTPPGFYGTDLSEMTDIRVPMMMATVFRPFPANRLQNSGHQWMEVLARLKPKVSRAQAEAGLDVIYRQIHENEIRELPPRISAYDKRVARSSHIKLLPGTQGLRLLQDQFSHALLILFGITLIILLITCANLANLFLARNAARGREIAMRLALGATRRRLVRQWLTESLLFASLGGAFGLLCAIWTQSALLHFLPASERMNLGRTTLDPVVFGFALAAAVTTAILFGIIPAFQISRGALSPQHGDPRLARSDMSPHRFRGALILLQIALSLPLLIGAGLFLHSLRNLKTIAPGFDESHVVLASLNPSLNGYPPERIRGLYNEFLTHVRGLPGVRSAALATGVVLSGGWDAITVNVENYQPREDEDMNPYSNLVSPDYFKTMQMPIVAGRDFNERDNLKSGNVGIINQTMARYFFGNLNPIGKKFGTDTSTPPDIEIIGVVQDAKYVSLKEKPKRHFYVSVGQEPRLFDMTLHVRTIGDVRPVVSQLRKALQQIDPNVPLYNITTLSDQLDDSLARDRLITWLTTAFGILATLLATIGLYGVIAFSVAQRTREIGIRMALGAQRFDVLRLVLQQVALLVFSGLALGAAISLGGVRALGSLLYDIQTTDPLAFLGAALVLLAAAALAAYPPARRATHVNPTVALRYE
jgi:putative ABC transport system permease protein